MTDRAGQVWRKTGMNDLGVYELVVLRSTHESRDVDIIEKGKFKVVFTGGTVHAVVKRHFKDDQIEKTDWYEPDFEPWENKLYFMRVL